MGNLLSTNLVPEQSYFNGWFIALQNYETFEIEVIKKKVTALQNDDNRPSTLCESLAANN